MAQTLEEGYRLSPHGTHLKMGLKDPSLLKDIDTSEVVPLGVKDKDEILGFYEESYPGNWFSPRMLETGRYFGIRRENRLASVAGVHVYSRKFRVAALGNIATHPKARGQGFAKKVTARPCGSLIRDTEHIGLNVKSDNHAATSIYRRLGFEVVASYEEHLAEIKQPRQKTGKKA